MATTPVANPADSAAAPAAPGCCPTVVEAPLGPDEADDLARTFAAVADPVRLRLLSLVAATGEVCSCDLTDPLDRSQPTVSHHTKALADTGLILGHKRGRWTYWRIAPGREDLVHRLLTAG